MKTVLLVILLFCSFTVAGQTGASPYPEAGGPKIYTLLLKDGSLVSGRIIRRDSLNLVVRQKNGRLTYVDLELFDRVITAASDNPSLPAGSIAQATVDDTNDLNNYLILFKDGTEVRGRIVSRDSTTLVIRKRNGEFSYADPSLVDQVQNLNKVGTVNPFAPFMILNQTAYTADPGKLYYRNIWLLYNEFTLGITRNWSIGAAVVPISGHISDWVYAEQSVAISTKLSFPLGDVFRIGASADYQPSGTYEYFKINAVWNIRAMASFGDKQRNITVGYGRASSGSNAQNRQPYFTVSALMKLTPELSFITDNTLYTNQNGYYAGVSSVFSAAFRFDRPRHAFDLGVLGQTYASTFYGSGGRNPQFYPYLAYNVRFGR